MLAVEPDDGHGDETGVPAGAELLAFADAVQRAYHTGDATALLSARAAVEQAVGVGGLVEAAATIAVFNGLVRVADGTGIQLDDGTMAVSADFRPGTGIDDYAGAVNTTVDPAPKSWSSVGDLFA